MSEKPVQFAPWEVRATIDGRKTQMRPIVKNAPGSGYVRTTPVAEERLGSLTCPFGAPGDHLWIREPFCPNYFDDGRPAYRADWTGESADMAKEPRWTSATSMPRALSRITLEIISVRVERLQDITGPDILREGVVERSHHHEALGKMPVSALDGRAYVDLVSLWAKAWDSINGKRAPWKSNPYVWRIEFRRTKP